MKIVREGKEIELTSEELAMAHAEFVTNFMRKTLEEDFDVAPEDSQQPAEQAYDRYCEGNGETEYECIEAVYSESGEDEEKLIRPATCQECFHCISFHSISQNTTHPRVCGLQYPPKVDISNQHNPQGWAYRWHCGSSAFRPDAISAPTTVPGNPSGSPRLRDT